MTKPSLEADMSYNSTSTGIDRHRQEKGHTYTSAIAQHMYSTMHFVLMSMRCLGRSSGRAYVHIMLHPHARCV